MVKKIVTAIVAMCLVGTVGFTAFGIYRSVSDRPSFYTGGYILQGDAGEAKQLNFVSDTSYTITRAGYVNFEDSEGVRSTVRRESFVYLNDNSVMALSAGILLDFNDLSENFINNYYIPSGMVISASGGSYTAQTTSGAMEFGENLWKLSDNKYLIQSSQLTVHFSDEDERSVESYVQVATTEDGIVQILTPENLWATISESCYIETAGGVRIYPVTQLVDNDSYKLSLPKLSVSTEDSIVLTEDETRRQIVPELNFTVEDGADGEDGVDGESGQNGENGEQGQNGETGQNGEDGVNGTTGRTGVDGVDGAAGAAGSNGAAGAAGSSGSSGKSGSSGSDGGTGPKGNDAQLSSSTNTALPTMTVTSWDVTATGLSGTIKITDESDLFVAMTDVATTDTTAYTPTITIYNEETGEPISCYLPGITDAGYSGFTLNMLFDGASINFTNLPSAGIGTELQPDTAYRLSVVAYYAANEMVYSREFLSRAFYTDSTGALLTYSSGTPNSLTVNASVSNEYQKNIQQMEVFLLTPEQNAALTKTNKDTTGSFTGKYVLTYQNGSITEAAYVDANGYPASIDTDTIAVWNGQSSATVEFLSLPANTQYVGRVYVTTKSSGSTLDMLTKQELSLTTLKTEPTWKSPDDEHVDLKPSAYYNRVTGAFEVSHPAVNDPDGGVKHYVYTAYNEKNEVVGTRTQAPNESGKVDFYLPQGAYKFKVQLEFDDNEKTVTYDMGETEEVVSTGGTMPRLTLSRENTDYNKMHGKLTIDLINAQTSLDVSANHPLTLHVYADQVYDRDIVIEGTSDVYTAGKAVGNKKSLYKASLTYAGGSNNNAIAALELDNLYQNTNYTITVTGYVNFGENISTETAGYTERAIGTVSFRTAAAPSTTSAWMGGTGSVTEAISRTLKIEPNLVQQDNETDGQFANRKTYIYNQLMDGQVTLRLYSGTGAGRTLLSEVKVTDAESLKAIYQGEDGFPVTNGTFDMTNLNTKSNYTLEVYQVADQTYGLTAELGYVNYFEVGNATTIVTAQATPPALTTNPTGGVTATPILNKNAATYGGQTNESLDDDAIVGYLLQAQYDNSQRLAMSVTYYPFEYQSFYNALVQIRQDPVQNAKNAMGGGAEAAGTLVDPKALTYNATGSDRVPGVALLFGNNPATKAPGALAGTHNGYNVYYAGEAKLTTGLDSGMDRGYRYIFAYTVEYSQTSGGDISSSATYPYGTGDYQDYMITYGAGTQFGKTLGAGVAYILNSGMQEAPKVEPKFYTYVYDTEEAIYQNGSSRGVLVIHYAWRDSDGAISLTTTPGITEIEYTASDGASLAKTKINENEVPGNSTPLKWYSIRVGYNTANNEGKEVIVSPKVNITRYLINYDDLMQNLTSGTEYANIDNSFYLCHIPVEEAWGNRFDSNPNQVLVHMNMEHQEENYIVFQLLDNDVGSNLGREMSQRAFAMRLEFKSQVSDAAPDKTIYLPVEYSAQFKYHVRLASGELGQEYLYVPFVVTASVLYDTGDQGWHMTEGDSRFAFQYINSSNDYEEFGFQTYYGLGSGQGAALLKRADGSSFSLVSLRGTLAGDEEKDQRTSIRVQSVVNQNNTQTWNLYPTHWGVNMSVSSSLEGMNRYIVPKRANEYALAFDTGNTGTLTTITPTITRGDLLPSSTAIKIEKFSISGKEQTLPAVGGPYQVYAALYKTEADAQRLGAEGRVSKVITFDLDDKGVFTPANNNNSLVIEDNSNVNHEARDYYIAFYVKMAPDGDETLLIDSKTAAKAIYRVTSSEDVIFESHLGALYYNTSYLSKQLELKFTMSRSANVKVRYDIYSSDNTLVMSQEDMVDKNITNPPTIYTTGSNTITVNMTPSQERELLLPGHTYYLKLTATEGNGTVEVGSKAFKFTLNPVVNYEPLVYVKDADSTSIQFQVTMNDVEHSFMSSSGDVANGAALFAVRFFKVTGSDNDETETLLFTKYDDHLFSSLNAQNLFTLNQEALTKPDIEGQKIEVGGRYRLKVFAVVDEDHTGLSRSVAKAGTEAVYLGWRDLFSEASIVVKPISETEAELTQTGGFIELLDSFWDSNGKTAEGMKDVQDRFTIGVKNQNTTDESGILLNHKRAAVTRISTSQLRMQLAESFGVITWEEVPDVGLRPKQTFQKVSWSINGQTSDGTPFNKEGVDTTQLFTSSTDAAGNSVYYYDIPCDVPTGAYYYITIQLFQDADGTVPYGTSFSFYHVG